jgi:uncharacterized protein (DUF1330 family)
MTEEVTMTAYAIAHLRTPTGNPEVFEYMERIQATMDPFEGRFLVHGKQVEEVEGSWPGTIVIIESPSIDAARRWYDSPAYQVILPLRTRNIEGETIVVEGVEPGYDPAGLAAAMRAAMAPPARVD